jgi:hypothetical protein
VKGELKQVVDGKEFNMNRSVKNRPEQEKNENAKMRIKNKDRDERMKNELKIYWKTPIVSKD